MRILAPVAPKCVWRPSFAGPDVELTSPRLPSWIWGRGWERGEEHRKGKGWGKGKVCEGKRRDEAGRGVWERTGKERG